MFMDNLPIVPCGRPHLVLTLHIKICRVSSIAHEEILLVYNCYRLSCHMVIRCAFLSKAEVFYPSKQHVLWNRRVAIYFWQIRWSRIWFSIKPHYQFPVGKDNNALPEYAWMLYTLLRYFAVNWKRFLAIWLFCTQINSKCENSEFFCDCVVNELKKKMTLLPFAPFWHWITSTKRNHSET